MRWSTILWCGRLKVSARKRSANAHADAVRESLPERPRRHLDAFGVAELRVARGRRLPLAEALQLLERQVVAGEVERRVLEDARMPGAEDEPVAVRPVRAGPGCAASPRGRGGRRAGPGTSRCPDGRPPPSAPRPSTACGWCRSRAVRSPSWASVPPTQSLPPSVTAMPTDAAPARISSLSAASASSSCPVTSGRHGAAFPEVAQHPGAGGEIALEGGANRARSRRRRA